MRISLFGLAFNTGVRRKPGGLLGKLIGVYAAAISIWIIYAAGFSRTDTLPLTITFLSLMLVLAFLLIGPTSTSPASWPASTRHVAPPVSIPSWPCVMTDIQ